MIEWATRWIAELQHGASAAQAVAWRWSRCATADDKPLTLFRLQGRIRVESLYESVVCQSGETGWIPRRSSATIPDGDRFRSWASSASEISAGRIRRPPPIRDHRSFAGTSQGARQLCSFLTATPIVHLVFVQAGCIWNDVRVVGQAASVKMG